MKIYWKIEVNSLRVSIKMTLLYKAQLWIQANSISFFFFLEGVLFHIFIMNSARVRTYIIQPLP